MTDLRQVEQRLLAVLQWFDGLLPSDELLDMRDLCTAGEPGVAFENFVTQLLEYEIGISAPVADELVALGTDMDLGQEYLTWVRELTVTET